MRTHVLKGKIIGNGTTIEAVASAIGVNRSTFYRKMKSNGGNFTVEEIKKIVGVLQLSKDEAVAIFFDI